MSDVAGSGSDLWGPPHPLSCKRACTPPPRPEPKGGGGGHARLKVREWGSPN